MKCPECDNIMEPISMSGNEEEIERDYHCEQCNCVAIVKWYPGKKRQSVVLEDLPF